MAGTFVDQAALAVNLDFVSKCRAAMIFRATQITTSSAAQTTATRQMLNQASTILQNAGADAQNMAWRVATGNSTISAAAPTVPTDSDTQFAVNTILTTLLT